MLKKKKDDGFQGRILKGKVALGWGLQVCDLLDWLLVKVTGWCPTSLVLSLKLLFFTRMKVLVLMCVRAKSPQACLTLCDPMDGSPPGSSIPGILQARTLEWAAISFSNAGKWSHSVQSNSWRPCGLQPSRLLCPWDFPGKRSAVGCHCLLQLVTA